jgi:pimeloyl-ACP methyl ester carboxylesterase
VACLIDMRRTIVLAALLAACSSEDPGPIEPIVPASLSGVVTNASGVVIDGATVKVGTAVATTGADGKFEVQNLTAGPVTIATSAPRFDERTETVILTAGANTRDMVLTLKTLFTFGNVQAYLPAASVRYKAAIVFLPGLMDPTTGNPLDSRGIVTGAALPACNVWCGTDRMTVRARSLELLGGDVALVGTTTLLDNSAHYDVLLTALADFATQSQHPELADIPILLVGHSMGGCTAYGFTRMHAARVAGFITMKGACHNLGPSQGAGAVPGYFLIGNQDEEYRRVNITTVFEAGRAGGAPWALSTDPWQHGPFVDLDLMLDWMEAVLAARLPATPGGPLVPVAENAGWLGNRSNGAIASWACYSAQRSSASWLPTQTTATNWQKMAGGSSVVSAC